MTLDYCPSGTVLWRLEHAEGGTIGKVVYTEWKLEKNKPAFYTAEGKQNETG
jgi:hypothetical protein